MSMVPCPTCSRLYDPTEGLLCPGCLGELRFVVRPEAHRETYRREIACEQITTDPDSDGIVVISTLPADNSLWICDLCNTQIPVTGEYTLIPLAGGYALCASCADSLPFWPDAWTQPTPRACRCRACQTPLLSALSRL